MYFAAETIQPMAIVGIVLGSILSMGALVAGAGYIWSRFSTGRSQAGKDAVAANSRLEQTLKDLLEAQDKKFKEVDERNSLNVKEIGRLQGVVEEQAKQTKWFEGIMIEALETFFDKNPNLAFELSTKIGSKKKPL